MSTIITYLEFVDATSHSHKFYEVTVQNIEVRVRFGRIGEQGQTQAKTYASPAKALAEANKKIQEKLRKGYLEVAGSPGQTSVQAVPIPQSQAGQTAGQAPGGRSPAPVAQPPQVIPPTTTPAKLPIVWQFNSGAQAFGLFVSQEYCWIGNQQGRVFRLDQQGQVVNQYQLPAGVKCLVEDDIWIYAGCDNGNVYDLTGKLVRLAYEIDQKVDIFWLDVHDGILAVADASGGLAKIDPEGEVLWTRLSAGKLAWMVRADDRGFYHGHTGGVTFYDRHQGLQLWHSPTEGKVLFGWQESDRIYAGTSGKKIVALDKATGSLESEYRCDASVYSCATAEGGRYVFAGDSAASIYCFDRQGQRLWKLLTGCGSALSMQFHTDHLYVVTSEGALACIDVRFQSIQSAHGGQRPQVISHQAPAGMTLTPSTALETVLETALETADQTTQGVIVECVRQEGKLRIRAVSPGYDSDWMVQFPRDIREEGRRYLVEELRTAKQGNFYRVYGEIKKLI